MSSDNAQTKIDEALGFMQKYGGIEGDHHRQWALDQVVRIFLGEGEAYEAWVKKHNEVTLGFSGWGRGTPP